MFGSDIDSRMIARLSSRELFSARAYPRPITPKVERGRSLLEIFSQVVEATNRPLHNGGIRHKKGPVADYRPLKNRGPNWD